MKALLNIYRDSDNTYPKEVELQSNTDGDRVIITLQNPERVFSVDRQELASVLEMFRLAHK